MKLVSCGIDQLRTVIKSEKLSKKSFGVLCHPSSVSSKMEHIIHILESCTQLNALFGPQHGIDCETQDNMIEWKNFRDKKGRPVYSLYGETRIPSEESLKDLDYMVIDLFDVGARLYTYIYTMSYMLEACAKAGVKVIICDRPNPLGGLQIEGSLLDLQFKSFVGLHKIPMRHGMTIGELALLFSESYSIQPEIRVLKCRSWKRSMTFDQTGIQWTLPSPNMPSYETARIFPGMVFLEATSLSEGRGTTRPFELIGAPFFDWDEIENIYREEAKRLELPPIVFHRQSFIPSFHKFAGEKCYGALQFPSKKASFQPVRYGVLMLWIFRKLYGNQWTWKQPPYEYEFEKLPIDILGGNTEIREFVDSQLPLKKLFNQWKVAEKSFKSQRKDFLLY